MEKEIDNAKEKGTHWMKEAKRMSAIPGEDVSGSFILPSHIRANMSAEESCESIVNYFSKISKEYTPIEEDQSSQWMEAQKKLDQGPCSHIDIQEHNIYYNMKTSKKTDSVPGDIPKTILQEFLPELASPITAILREAVASHTWPDIYKKEYHLPLKKVPAPETEDHLRGIGMTAWISKQLERLLLDWIWPYLQPHLDPDQMGGRKGCSVEHYIIKMVHFIQKSMDQDRNAAVLSVPVDFSKAFNRMLHSDILCNLVALNVPNCTVKLIKSYLTQRSMCVRYRGAVSSFQSCPGGGPQGGLLTRALFCLQVNNAGRPFVITQHPSLGQPAAQPPSMVQESSDQQLPLSPVQDFLYSAARPHLDFSQTGVLIDQAAA